MLSELKIFNAVTSWFVPEASQIQCDCISNTLVKRHTTDLIVFLGFFVTVIRCSAEDICHFCDSHADLPNLVLFGQQFSGGVPTHAANCFTQETGAVSELKQSFPFPYSKWEIGPRELFHELTDKQKTLSDACPCASSAPS